jgi:hypothetical protein
MALGETVILAYILTIMKYYKLFILDVPRMVNTAFKLYEPIKNSCLDVMCFGRVYEE